MLCRESTVSVMIKCALSAHNCSDVFFPCYINPEICTRYSVKYTTTVLEISSNAKIYI
jgi:hypothetical protein